MPSFNFKKRFARMVESGEKCTTIRPIRKNTPKIGDAAHLFTGQRTKYCRKLGIGRITSVKPFSINGLGEIWFDQHWATNQVADGLAKTDGFKTTGNFIQFFENLYGLPFKGMHVTWELVDD